MTDSSNIAPILYGIAAVIGAVGAFIKLNEKRAVSVADGWQNIAEKEGKKNDILQNQNVLMQAQIDSLSKQIIEKDVEIAELKRQLNQKTP